jgi:membrane protease YdiL (CAAX protease family)
VSSSKDLCTVTVNYLPCSAAFLACLASYVLTYFWVQDFLVDIGIAQSLFRYMYSVLWSLFLTCLFFLGSVYMLCEQHDFFRQPAVFQTFLIDNANWIKHLVINTWSYSDYITVRALIVGPITEEIVYRSCMVSCLLASGWDAWNSVVISSVLFVLLKFNFHYSCFLYPFDVRHTSTVCQTLNRISNAFAHLNLV